ncbi:hypothetical protein [Rugosimonospora africana]|uniref:hypothetical protein n=1 Tax=Rugosimonospora africana TaxID=556532 RepID=UPI0019439D6D|nr:hypothetical protein [Rugosimonospora africana]
MWRHSWGFWLGTGVAAILLCNLLVFGVVLVRYLLERDNAEEFERPAVSRSARRIR